MWARVIECILAIRLALSPCIIQESFWGINNFVCAFLVVSFALLSFWYPLRKMHLLNLIIAFWLWGLGYSTFPEMASPLQENSVVIGLLLLMLAIVPSHSNHLSHSWQEFIRSKKP